MPELYHASRNEKARYGGRAFMAVARRFSATGADQASNDHMGDGALTSLHAISFARTGFQFELFPHLRAGVLNHESQVFVSKS